MSGHSHWATIKRKKGAADAKRGQVFSKLAQEIRLAARENGADPQMNARLRLAIDRAKTENMPKSKIEAAIKKVTQGPDQGDLAEITLEGYGPEGVAVVVKAETDNKNRTLAEIRNVFQRFGGALGGQGSAAFVFDQKGAPQFKVPIKDEEKAGQVLGLIEALEEQEEVTEVWTNLEARSISWVA